MSFAKSRKLMGLDLGDERIGIAVCFRETKIAIPKGHLDRNTLRTDWGAPGLSTKKMVVVSTFG